MELKKLTLKYLSDKLGSHVTENDGIVGLGIVIRYTDTALFKQFLLPTV